MAIELTGKIAPKNNGAFPIAEDVNIEGGYQVRSDITDRNNIPALNRKQGMLVKVLSDGKFYTLSGGIDNSNWIEVSFGGGSSPSIDFTGYGIIQDGLAEVGQYITNARFKASYNFTPVSVILTDNDGTDPKDVSANPDSFFSDGYFQKNTFGQSVTFTLTADSNTSTFSITWGQRNYFGVGPAGNNTESFILELSSVINNSVESMFVVNAGPTDKIYIAFRAAYGTPNIYVNGFEGGFALVSNSIPVTNQYGFVENYSLYESDNAGLGVTSVEVF